MPPQDDFMKNLAAMFKVEAQEHLQAISSGLIELEKSLSPDKQKETVETVFREAHSLKGAARSVGLNDIESVCQSLENVFAALKRNEIALSPELFDLLHRATDNVGGLITSTAPDKAALRKLIQELGNAAIKQEERMPAAEGAAASPAPPPSSMDDKPLPTETIRISAAKLDALLLEAEEMVTIKMMLNQHAAELRQIRGTMATWKTEWGKINAEARALKQTRNNHSKHNHAQLTRVLGFLDWNAECFKTLDEGLTVLAKSAEQDQRATVRMVDGLLDDAKKVVMLPVSSLLDIFPKMARDLLRDQNKEADLIIRGREIEIDKRILEEMKDPLIHLVRNCIDHGIEKAPDRIGKHKSPRGTITISFESKDSNRVELLVADDGAGIDVERVKSAAIKQGTLTSEDAARLDPRAVLALIFESGISTSPLITDLSGRGLGLAIVREKVEKIGGVLSLDSQTDGGVTFRILLPLTLATFRGVRVRVGEHEFVLPTINVERALRIHKEEIKTVENRETIRLKEQLVSWVRLDDVLKIPRAPSTDDERVKAVVLVSADKRIAFQVDEVLNEQEVLVKSLGKQLARVRNIAGATVLGNGKAVPVLNVADLMKSAAKAGASGVAAAPAEAEAKQKSVLVVEDSITARTLLNNILAAAGYAVSTAVDGVEAFTQLRSRQFDLVVSDVEMPRLDGFGLTAKIRADKKLSEMPVVLVTALESREDRERGVDVGANAYIVKSSFDQSNLLEVIQTLI